VWAIEAPRATSQEAPKWSTTHRSVVKEELALQLDTSIVYLISKLCWHGRAPSATHTSVFALLNRR